MTRSFTYDGATELAGATRLGNFSFSSAAHKGEVGDGGFDFDNPTSAANIVGLKSFTAEEDDSTPALFFSGFIADRGIGRGPFRVDSDSQWQTAVVDINSYLDDIVLRADDANRPAETDVARITWLLGSGALAVADTYFITSSPVDMDPADYRGRHARDVLDECGEASGNNYFLRDDGSGPFLSYYDSTGSTDPATGSISSVASEVDNTTTFAPAWGDVPALQRDPSRVYSGVQVQFADGQSAFVENATTLSTFRRRETSVFDSAATTIEGATTIANQFLEAAATEEDTIECPLILPSDKLGLYKQGQKVNTNFPHLGGSFSYRISRKTVAPAGEDAPSHDHYLVTLILTVPVKITRFSGRGGTAGGALASSIPGPFLPRASCFYDYFDRTVADGWGGDWGYTLDDPPACIPQANGTAGIFPFTPQLDPGPDYGPVTTCFRSIPEQPGVTIKVGFHWDSLPVSVNGQLSIGVSAYKTSEGFFGASVGMDENGDGALTVTAEPLTLGTSVSSTWGPGPYTLTVNYVPGVGATATCGAATVFDPNPACAPNLNTLTVVGGIVESILETRTLFVDYIEILGCAPVAGQPVPLATVAVADGSTTGFHTAFPYQPGSLRVLVDRIDWTNEVTELDPAAGTFEFDTAPFDTDTIDAYYVAG